MKRMFPALLAMSLTVATSCTAEQLAMVTQVAEAYGAQISLTQTDEYGVRSAVAGADVTSIELDSRTIPADFAPDGQLRLPAGDYSRDREVTVRLRDGSTVSLPLNAGKAARQGRSYQVAGALNRQSGRVVAADLVPALVADADAYDAALDATYVQVPINRPALQGRLQTISIDGQRLPADACRINAQGDLMIQRTLLQQHARQGSRLWMVVDLETTTCAGSAYRSHWGGYAGT
jgi:hypothetical protein